MKNLFANWRRRRLRNQLGQVTRKIPKPIYCRPACRPISLDEARRRILRSPFPVAEIERVVLVGEGAARAYEIVGSFAGGQSFDVVSLANFTPEAMNQLLRPSEWARERERRENELAFARWLLDHGRAEEELLEGKDV